MSAEHNLTNEELSKLFDNPFDLVNHAIGVAHHLVESGRELSDSSGKNCATQILKKMVKDHQGEEMSRQVLAFQATTPQEENKDHPQTDS